MINLYWGDTKGGSCSFFCHGAECSVSLREVTLIKFVFNGSKTVKIKKRGKRREKNSFNGVGSCHAGIDTFCMLRDKLCFERRSGDCKP